MLGGGGGLLAQNPRHVPLGRYLVFSAPLNAEMADEAIAGTAVDRIAVQRLVRGSERVKLLAAIFGPPGIIYQLESHPERAEFLYPMLRSSIRSAAPYMVSAIKKVRAKEKASQEACEELARDDPNYVPGTPIEDYIIGMIFAGWTPPDMQQSESANGQQPIDVEVVQ